MGLLEQVAEEYKGKYGEKKIIRYERFTKIMSMVTGKWVDDGKPDRLTIEQYDSGKYEDEYPELEFSEIDYCPVYNQDKDWSDYLVDDIRKLSKTSD